MRKMNIARRRGTTIAAAALSMALIAPAVQAVAEPPESAPVQGVSAANGDSALEDAINAGAKVIDADPIASKRITKPAQLTDVAGAGYGLLSGHIVEATPGASTAANPYTAGGTGGIHAPEGTYVYAQFRDTDGSVSPIFRTQVHYLQGTVVGLNGGQGTFAFGATDVEDDPSIPEITAEPGTPEYDAQVKAAADAAEAAAEASDVPRSVSGSKRRGGMEWTDANGNIHRFHAHPAQQYRLWVSPYENEHGQLVEPFRQINGVAPGSFVSVSTIQNNGAWPSVRNAMNLTGMVMKERPAQWMVGKDSEVMKKAIFDDQGPLRNAETTTGVDRFIAGEVWLEAGNGTSLVNAPVRDGRDRAAAGYRVYAATLTREGANKNEAIKNLSDPAERTAATRNLLEDVESGKYVLKTVWGYTDNDGYYTLRFDDKNNPSTELHDYLDGDNLFMWVTDPTGDKILPTYSPYITNSFYHHNDNLAWSSGSPYWRPARKAIANQHFAVMLNESLDLDIVNFDSAANPAAQGDEAKIEVKGTFPPFDAESDWVNVVWRDSKNNELKRCDKLRNAAHASECSYTIEDKVQDGEIITAELEVGGRVVAADSLVVRDRERDNGKYTPEYEERQVPQNPVKPIIVPAPKNTQKDADGTVKPLPNGTKFTEGNVVVGPNGPLQKKDGTPEPQDWFTVNEDGSISVSPKEDTPVGDYKIPVVVTYPDGTKETIYAPVKVVEASKKPEANDTKGVADEITPSWKNSTAPAGKPVGVPNIGETIPDGSKVEAKSEQPGWTVEAPKVPNGEIIVTPPSTAKTGEKSKIWVTVTYPDGSQDVEEFTVTVQNPNDEGDLAAQTTPDWKNSESVPGKPVVVPNTGDKLPDGSTVDAPKEIDGWKIEVGGKDADGKDKPIDSITVTPPQGAKPGDKIEVPVTITYPDGSTDVETFTVTVTTPQSTETTPRWDNTETERNKPVIVPNTGDPLPQGSKVTAQPDNKDWTVSPDEDGKVTVSPDEDGKVTVTPPANAKPGDKTKVTVTVTYPDGSTDTEEFTVTVTDPNNPGNTATETTPKWENQETKPGDPVKVPNTGDPIPPGSEFTVETNQPGWKATVDEQGTVTVTPPADSKPGDKTTVTVTVKYPGDNGTDTETFTVTVVENVTLYTVGYPNTPAKLGETVTAKPQFSVTPEAKTFAEVPGAKNTHDGLWKIGELDTASGDVEATAPKLTSDDPNEKTLSTVFKEITKDDKCTEQSEKLSDARVKEIIAQMKKYFSADTKVDVKGVKLNGKDLKDSLGVPVVFTLVDENGKPLADSNDWDGDGVDNETEIRDCKNPFDPKDQNATDDQNQGTDKHWEDTTVPPGEATPIKKSDQNPVPAGSTVKVPETVRDNKDNTWTVEQDPKDPSNIVVTAPKEAKTGDKAEITIEVTQGGKTTTQTVTVTVQEKQKGSDAESYDPQGKDQPVKKGETPDPKKNIVDPEKLPEGTEFKYKEEVDTTTPGTKDVVVVVTYPDGSTDEVKTTVTVTEDKATNDASSQIDGSKCVPPLLGFGLPLLALVPLGIAAQSAIPGLSSIKEDIGAQIRNANTELQKQLGILDPNLAKAHENFNAQIAAAGADLSQVLFGLAALAYGIAAIATIATNCAPQSTPVPEDKQSSQKNIQSNISAGSSGREGTSQRNGADAEKPAGTSQRNGNNAAADNSQPASAPAEQPAENLAPTDTADGQ